MTSWDFVQWNDTCCSIVISHISRNIKFCSVVQVGSAMTWNKGVNLSRRQFCFDLAEMFLVFFKEHDAMLSPRNWYKTYSQESYGIPQPREAWCGTVWSCRILRAQAQFFNRISKRSMRYVISFSRGFQNRPKFNFARWEVYVLMAEKLVPSRSMTNFKGCKCKRANEILNGKWNSWG